IQLRPDPGPGGGDTDVAVDDQGNAYFVDLEALVNLGTSVSNDGGNTWRKNPAAVQNSAVDRQWYAVDDGTTPAADDNTVFLAFLNYKGPKSPGGKLLNLFPAVATDRAGNVYIAWIDGANFHLYYAFSTDQGRTWSAPVKVNSGPAVTNEFDWAQGGSPGTLALAWYATRKTAQGGSDGMPNYLNDPAGAAAFPWLGYTALITGANT